MPKKIEQWYTVIMVTEFQSSSGPTPQFVSFAKLVNKWFKEFCKKNNFTDLKISRGHFYLNGYFKVGNQWWNFSTLDVRSKLMGAMCIRKAESDKDYQWVKYDENFELNLFKIMGGS